MHGSLPCEEEEQISLIAGATMAVEGRTLPAQDWGPTRH